MASFRLRFVVFASVRSENIPLFPSGTACSIPILGQKWVKSKSVALQTGSYLSQVVNADGGQAAYLADIEENEYYSGMCDGDSCITVGLSMMCYTLGKAERTCRGERQARGLIGKLLY